MKVYSIIPARKGSKGIIDKNIMEYKYKPLITHSIIQSKQSKYITKTFVSTDSVDYAIIAKSQGAIVPFIRPSEFSQDESNDIQFMEHFVEYMHHSNDICDLIVHLRPTSPERTVYDIDKAIELFIDNIHGYDSLRSVIEFDKCVFKTYIFEDNMLKPIFPKYDAIDEPYNIGRQQLPKTYIHNGYIDILKPSTIIQYSSVSGNRILPYIMKATANIDIDHTEDIPR